MGNVVGDIVIGQLLAWEQYLERRRALYAYMSNVPEGRVNLDVLVDEDGAMVIGGAAARALKSSEEETERRDALCATHLNASGIENVPCGTIACLAGWMMTMPQVKKYLVEKGMLLNTVMRLTELQTYIGFVGGGDESKAYETFAFPFSSRTVLEFKGRYAEMNDWQVAMERCTQLVRYAEARCQALQELLPQKEEQHDNTATINQMADVSSETTGSS